MNQPRIKICGITRPEDALHAEAAGADAIGFVFVPKSRRNIPVEAAANIAAMLGPYITVVGLFLDAARTDVEAALSAIPDLVPQFHGQESGEYCDGFGRSYVKAIGVGNGMPAADELQRYQRASAFLFDSNVAGELGGTGHVFDWDVLRGYAGKPLVLAGGLDENNVATAIQTVSPYAVDVSSGVESAPGIKESGRVSRFINLVRGV